MSYSTKVISTLSSREFLKMCTLSYIVEKNDSAYGREIMENLKENLKSKESLWFPSHGSLYPTLDEMVKNEILYIEEEEGKRKYYKLTKKGEEYYKEASKDFVDTLKKTSKFYEEMAKGIVLFDNEENENKNELTKAGNE